MRNILKKTEFTFAIKIGLLFGLILFASTLKDKNNSNEADKSLVQSVTSSISSAIFTNF